MAVKTYIVFPSYAIVSATDQFDLLFDMRHIYVSIGMMTKYLGVTLHTSTDLKWKKHVNNIMSQTKVKLY
jgi:hypothetical protein